MLTARQTIATKVVVDSPATTQAEDAAANANTAATFANGVASNALVDANRAEGYKTEAYRFAQQTAGTVKFADGSDSGRLSAYAYAGQAQQEAMTATTKASEAVAKAAEASTAAGTATTKAGEATVSASAAASSALTASTKATEASAAASTAGTKANLAGAAAATATAAEVQALTNAGIDGTLAMEGGLTGQPAGTYLIRSYTRLPDYTGEPTVVVWNGSAVTSEGTSLIARSEKAAPSGVASLDAAKRPQQGLPAYNASLFPSLQDALDAVASGGTLVIPEGTHAVSSKLTMSLAAGAVVHLKGENRVIIDSSVTDPGGSVLEGIIEITGTSTSALIAENIEIAHNAVSKGVLSGFYAKGGFKNIHLEAVRAEGTGYWGILVEDADSGLIENCHGLGNMEGGLGLRGCYNLNVQGGTYNVNGDGTTVNGYGISLSVATSSRINKNINIEGATAEGNDRKAIDVHCGHNVKIDGNRVDGFGSSGIYAVNEGATKDVRDVTITNNTIDAEGQVFTQATSAIEIGAFGASALESGTFIVAGNIIKNFGGATYAHQGVFVRTPSAGRTPPSKIIVTDNAISGTTLERAIYSDNAGDNIPDIIATGNVIELDACPNPVYLREVDRVTVASNHIRIKGGTPQSAIIAPAAEAGTVEGNIISGVTYAGDVVPAFSTLIVKNNRLNGMLLPERHSPVQQRFFISKALAHGVNTKVLSMVDAGSAAAALHGEWMAHWGGSSSRRSVRSARFITAARWDNGPLMNLPGGSPHLITQIGEVAALVSGVTGSFAWTLVATSATTVELYVQPTFSATGSTCQMEATIDLLGDAGTVTIP